MAADDVATAVGRVAVGAPVNGIVEIGGPEQFRFDEVIRRVLAATNDPREVVADPNAGYFGIAVGERTLVPGDGASLGRSDWTTGSAGPPPRRRRPLSRSTHPGLDQVRRGAAPRRHPRSQGSDSYTRGHDASADG